MLDFLCPIYNVDFYKTGHPQQYPRGTEFVYANWTPRSSRIAGRTHVIPFGLQVYIKEVLLKQWNNQFFWKPLGPILDEYKTFIRATLGVKEPYTAHLEALHAEGRLPLNIFALPEGIPAPLNVPQFVIHNTAKHAYWLPNNIESDLSNRLWKASTSATTAKVYREIFVKYARLAGEKDLSFVNWQGHDFSYRGMSGFEDAVFSGLGHLLSFNGTDTVPAIFAAREFYGADFSVGGSVPATEHSVMCAGSKEGEFETFRRLITEVHPSGIVSIVSDTWDLWKVLTDIVPRLKETILAREGKVVIRPDSGDPVLILCGDPAAAAGSPAAKGTLRLLAEALGTTQQVGGLPLINKAAAIYGDAITPERATQILDRTVNELKLSPYNVVFGIGSFTYEYCTRDNNGFAMKATAVQREGQGVEAIFKAPVTDNGGKKSHKGIPVVYREAITSSGMLELGDYVVRESTDPEDLYSSASDLVFADGHLIQETKFETIRRRVRAGLE